MARGCRLAFLMLLLALAACRGEDNPLFGDWVSTIADEQRQDLGIERRLDDGRMLVRFTEAAVEINGTVTPVTYKHNLGTWFAHQTGTDRTFSMLAREDGSVRFRAPGHYRREIYEFVLTRKAE